MARQVDFPEFRARAANSVDLGVSGRIAARSDCVVGSEDNLAIAVAITAAKGLSPAAMPFLQTSMARFISSV